MTNDSAKGILFPAIARSWGSSAQYPCNGVLCRQKPLSMRSRIHHHNEECPVCYELDLRLRCGLPPKG